MKCVIGVDFDNTIADYDHVFAKVAKDMGFMETADVLSKSGVKNYLLSQTGGNLNWQRLQGQIYGKYMSIAEIFPGFMEFLLLAKIKNDPVFIISHKSEFGHFDENKISLRSEAIKWILSKKIVSPGKYKLSVDDIFFETTREEKISRIIELGCTCFVDDLQEVFNEINFPAHINKYLFDPQRKAENNSSYVVVDSWRSITRNLLGEWENEEVSKAVQIVFPELEVQDVEMRKGRGNSRIYKLELSNFEKYALKIYPDRQRDLRKRLETEFSVLAILGEAGFPVPKAVAMDGDVNWAVYSWIEGAMSQPDEFFLDESVDFIKRLRLLSQSSEKFKGFSNASEACLHGKEIEKQINDRLSILKSVSSEELHQFLDVEFSSALHDAIQSAKTLFASQFEIPLQLSLQIPSPSDFGSHNAIKDSSGKTVFIDFEYFGWDDPVKLVSDFYWHPAMDLSEELRILWLNKTKNIFEKDDTFEARLSVYLPLFGLRWCLILLNEFLPHRMQQRIHADKSKIADIQEIQSAQLAKSKKLLEKIIKINTNHGSTFQISEKINC